MRFKQTVAALLALLLFLAGCGKTDISDQPTQPQNTSPQSEAESYEMQLLFCANDSLNPYKTISKTNAEIAQLIYEPLVKLNDNFEPVYALAQSVQTEGNRCRVSLRDAQFSDGSSLTADDVVFSYQLARECERFAYLFYEVTGVSAVDSRTVEFQLSSSDMYFASLLSFPIIKRGSEDLKNEDNVEISPTGCGRFVFSTDEQVLLPNDRYYGTKSRVSKIRLINAPDSESVQHYVEVGASDLYYTDLSDEKVIRMSGKRQSVNLNNLIYIGMNQNYAPLADVALRHAISSALDRAALVNHSFYGNAVAADGFFHPDWQEVAGYQTIQSSPDIKIAIENLEKVGYNRLDNDGIRMRADGLRLAFTLLVNKDNGTKLAAAQRIAEQLRTVGIEIRLTAVSADQYRALLETGNFQLYLGEVKLLANMDIRPLVLHGGSAAYGIAASSPLSPAEPAEDGEESEQELSEEAAYLSVINGVYEGTNRMADLASALLAAMPVIPVAYRKGIVFYSDQLPDIGAVSASDLFSSLQN